MELGPRISLVVVDGKLSDKFPEFSLVKLLMFTLPVRPLVNVKLPVLDTVVVPFTLPKLKPEPVFSTVNAPLKTQLPVAATKKRSKAVELTLFFNRTALLNTALLI